MPAILRKVPASGAARRWRCLTARATTGPQARSVANDLAAKKQFSRIQQLILDQNRSELVQVPKEQLVRYLREIAPFEEDFDVHQDELVDVLMLSGSAGGISEDSSNDQDLSFLDDTLSPNDDWLKYTEDASQFDKGPMPANENKHDLDAIMQDDVEQSWFTYSSPPPQAPGAMHALIRERNLNPSYAADSAADAMDWHSEDTGERDSGAYLDANSSDSDGGAWPDEGAVSEDEEQEPGRPSRAGPGKLFPATDLGSGVGLEASQGSRAVVWGGTARGSGGVGGSGAQDALGDLQFAGLMGVRRKQVAAGGSPDAAMPSQERSVQEEDDLEVQVELEEGEWRDDASSADDEEVLYEYGGDREIRDVLDDINMNGDGRDILDVINDEVLEDDGEGGSLLGLGGGVRSTESSVLGSGSGSVKGGGRPLLPWQQARNTGPRAGYSTQVADGLLLGSDDESSEGEGGYAREQQQLLHQQHQGQRVGYLRGDVVDREPRPAAAEAAGGGLWPAADGYVEADADEFVYDWEFVDEEGPSPEAMEAERRDLQVALAQNAPAVMPDAVDGIDPTVMGLDRTWGGAEAAAAASPADPPLDGLPGTAPSGWTWAGVGALQSWDESEMAREIDEIKRELFSGQQGGHSSWQAAVESSLVTESEGEEGGHAQSVLAVESGDRGSRRETASRLHQRAVSAVRRHASASALEAGGAGAALSPAGAEPGVKMSPAEESKKSGKAAAAQASEIEREASADSNNSEEGGAPVKKKRGRKPSGRRKKRGGAADAVDVDAAAAKAAPLVATAGETATTVAAAARSAEDNRTQLDASSPEQSVDALEEGVAGSPPEASAAAAPLAVAEGPVPMRKRSMTRQEKPEVSAHEQTTPAAASTSTSSGSESALSMEVASSQGPAEAVGGVPSKATSRRGRRRSMLTGADAGIVSDADAAATAPPATAAAATAAAAAGGASVLVPVTPPVSGAAERAAPDEGLAQSNSVGRTDAGAAAASGVGQDAAGALTAEEEAAPKTALKQGVGEEAQGGELQDNTKVGEVEGRGQAGDLEEKAQAREVEGRAQATAAASMPQAAAALELQPKSKLEAGTEPDGKAAGTSAAGASDSDGYQASGIVEVGDSALVATTVKQLGGLASEELSQEAVSEASALEASAAAESKGDAAATQAGSGAGKAATDSQEQPPQATVAGRSMMRQQPDKAAAAGESSTAAAEAAEATAAAAASPAEEAPAAPAPAAAAAAAAQPRKRGRRRLSESEKAQNAEARKASRSERQQRAVELQAGVEVRKQKLQWLEAEVDRMRVHAVAADQRQKLLGEMQDLRAQLEGWSDSAAMRAQLGELKDPTLFPSPDPSLQRRTEVTVEILQDEVEGLRQQLAAREDAAESLQQDINAEFYGDPGVVRPDPAGTGSPPDSPTGTVAGPYTASPDSPTRSSSGPQRIGFDSEDLAQAALSAAEPQAWPPAGGAARWGDASDEVGGDPGSGSTASDGSAGGSDGSGSGSTSLDGGSSARAGSADAGGSAGGQAGQASGTGSALSSGPGTSDAQDAGDGQNIPGQNILKAGSPGSGGKSGAGASSQSAVDADQQAEGQGESEGGRDAQNKESAGLPKVGQVVNWLINTVLPRPWK